MTTPSAPANPVLSALPDAANSLTPEKHVRAMGGELVKQDGRVLVRLAGVAEVGDMLVSYELIPTNGVLAKASKWRNMTPENQLLVVTQRVNAKALATLNKQVCEFVGPLAARAQRNGLDATTFLAALSQTASTDPAELQFQAIDQRLTNSIEKHQEARHAALTRDSINLSEYPESFEMANRLPRKFIAYLGPTNSGKTHKALEALVNAKSGIYLAPLRLLALEGYERLVAQLEPKGGKVSLITGEERRVLEGATHVASTVEMLDTRTKVEVAVIDEIQMLGDRDRGAAWTAAVCGAPASTVYMVGALEARAAIEALAKRMNLPLEVHVLERKAPLTVQPSAVGKMRNLKKGDAVIAFSRRDVLLWRDLVTEAGFSVSTIYGNLSPEVRRAQAERFRDGSADIVVGTDCLAMGLNLPVSRIIFSVANKFNGVEEEELPAALAQQIGGRAGRFGLHEAGFVAGFDDGTHRFVRALLQEKVQPLSTRGFFVAPTLEHLTRISQATAETALAQLLKRFARNIDVADGYFKPRITEDQTERALWLDTLPLSLEEKFTLSLVPISSRITVLNNAWQDWAKSMARKKPCILPPSSPNKGANLQDTEDLCKLYSAYAWLGYRCPEYFPSGEQALKAMRAASDWVDAMLEAKNKAQRKTSSKREDSSSPARPRGKPQRARA